MVRRWQDLTHRQKKIVMGLARSTRASGPMMVAWLNDQAADEHNVWESIDSLATLFEKNWKR
jgi:hypothetical protein